MRSATEICWQQLGTGASTASGTCVRWTVGRNELSDSWTRLARQGSDRRSAILSTWRTLRLNRINNLCQTLSFNSYHATTGRRLQYFETSFELFRFLLDKKNYRVWVSSRRIMQGNSIINLTLTRQHHKVRIMSRIILLRMLGRVDRRRARFVTKMGDRNRSETMPHQTHYTGNHFNIMSMGVTPYSHVHSWREKNWAWRLQRASFAIQHKFSHIDWIYSFCDRLGAQTCFLLAHFG